MPKQLHVSTHLQVSCSDNQMKTIKLTIVMVPQFTHQDPIYQPQIIST